MLQTELSSLGKNGAEIAVIPGNISNPRGPQLCIIIRKLHLWHAPD
jgi:hypothetical protein